MNQPFLRTAELSDIDQIHTLMESIFGFYPNLDEVFAQWISNDHYNVVLAQFHEKIIGVSTWCLKQDIDFLPYESFGKQAIDFLTSHKLAWVLNLAVYPEYRRNKIGEQLSLVQIKWMKERDCTAVAGTSWVNGTADNSQHLYFKAGFQQLGVSKDFLRLQMQNGALCSVCKTSGCSCLSILYAIQTEDLLKISSKKLYFFATR